MISPERDTIVRFINYREDCLRIFWGKLKTPAESFILWSHFHCDHLIYTHLVFENLIQFLTFQVQNHVQNPRLPGPSEVHFPLHLAAVTRIKENSKCYLNFRFQYPVKMNLPAAPACCFIIPFPIPLCGSPTDRTPI